MKRRLIIIDANALIHRAYHALPKLTTKKGEPIGAVYGFLLLFFRALGDFHPDFICACFDLAKPTFRHREFKEYKSQRPKTPEELVRQIPKVKEFLKVFRVPVLEKEGFEADDLLATIARKCQMSNVKWQNHNSKVKTKEKEGLEIIILSGDLDTLQLVNEKTKVYTPKRGIRETILYDEEKVKERYGLGPEKLVDFKALVGDPSDNIPGVPGIGEKTATKLVQEFGSIENLYQELQTPSSELRSNSGFQIPNKLKTKLIEYKGQVFFSKMLVKARADVEIDFDLAEARWRQYNPAEARELLEKYEFKSLLERMPGIERKNKDLF